MFWLSYECFSTLCNAFLLKSAISSQQRSSCENTMGRVATNLLQAKNIWWKECKYVLNLSPLLKIFGMGSPCKSNKSLMQSYRGVCSSYQPPTNHCPWLQLNLREVNSKHVTWFESYQSLYLVISNILRLNILWSEYSTL